MPRRSQARVTGVWEKEPGSESAGFAIEKTASSTGRKWGGSRTPSSSIKNAKTKSGRAQSSPRTYVGRRFVSGSSLRTSGPTAKGTTGTRGTLNRG